MQKLGACAIPQIALHAHGKIVLYNPLGLLAFSSVVLFYFISYILLLVLGQDFVQLEYLCAPKKNNLNDTYTFFYKKPIFIQSFYKTSTPQQLNSVS